MKRFLILSFCLLACGCFGPSPEQLAEEERKKAEEARAAELASAELDREKQKAIWDAEHVTFELEWRFGPLFKKALKERSSEKLAVWLRESFVGAVLSDFFRKSTR